MELLQISKGKQLTTIQQLLLTQTMKKILFSLLAVAALASCAKSGIVYEADSEIRLTPKVAPATRANYLGAIATPDYPVAENFDVYGYWAEDWTNGKIVNYLVSENEESGVEFECQGNYWTGKKSYHWPKDGSLKFACYSPATADIKHNYPTDTYSKVGYEQPNETALTWDLLLAPTTGAYTAETASENVPVAFEHALAWITIQVKAKDADAENIFDIKKVTIKNVCTKANFEVKMADGIQYEEWEKQSEKKDIVVFDGTQVVKQEAKDIETTPQGTIIIPQVTEGTELVIEYTQLPTSNTAELTDQTITLPLTLNPTRSVWEPGKHYTYTLTFKVEEIRIKPSVKPWGSVNVENIL